MSPGQRWSLAASTTCSAGARRRPPTSAGRDGPAASGRLGVGSGWCSASVLLSITVQGALCTKATRGVSRGAEPELREFLGLKHVEHGGRHGVFLSVGFGRTCGRLRTYQGSSRLPGPLRRQAPAHLGRTRLRIVAAADTGRAGEKSVDECGLALPHKPDLGAAIRAAHEIGAQATVGSPHEVEPR